MSEVPRYFMTHNDVTVECVVIQDETERKTTVIPINPPLVTSGETVTITGGYETELE